MRTLAALALGLAVLCPGLARASDVCSGYITVDAGPLPDGGISTFQECAPPPSDSSGCTSTGGADALLALVAASALLARRRS